MTAEEVIRRLVDALRALHYRTTVDDENFHVVNEAHAAACHGEEWLEENSDAEA
jgi:hypothetical protein